MIAAEVEQWNIKIQFMEKLIKQYEELYKIELNKKAIVKSGYDDLAARTSSQVSQDALWMSLSTLQDLQPRIMQMYQS